MTSSSCTSHTQARRRSADWKNATFLRLNQPWIVSIYNMRTANCSLIKQSSQIQRWCAAVWSLAFVLYLGESRAENWPCPRRHKQHETLLAPRWPTVSVKLISLCNYYFHLLRVYSLCRACSSKAMKMLILRARRSKTESEMADDENCENVKFRSHRDLIESFDDIFFAQNKLIFCQSRLWVLNINQVDKKRIQGRWKLLCLFVE